VKVDIHKMAEEVRATKRRRFAEHIAVIEANETNYDVRYVLVLEAVAMATQLGYQAGFRIDPAEPDWPVAYIELPTGQVSWHLPAHPVVWDGHTTPEKYARIRQYCEAAK
jgi:hypothetical protein